MEFAETLWYLLPLLFAAGVIDGAVGGGGLIALPAYLMTGMPIPFAYGCNKLQSLVGTAASLGRYAKSGHMDWKAGLLTALAALPGAYLGTRLVQTVLDEGAIRVMMLVLVPLVFVLMVAKNRMRKGECTRVRLTVENTVKCLLLGLALGLYDGTFGPGGGTVGMILFSVVLGYDAHTGNANTKVIIMASNLIAVVTYALHGSIFLHIALPAAAANFLGSYMGAGLALKHGKRLVMPLMSGVVITLLVQTVLQMGA